MPTQGGKRRQVRSTCESYLLQARQIEQQQQQRSERPASKNASVASSELLKNMIELTLKKDAKLSSEVVDIREVFDISSKEYSYAQCATFMNLLRESNGRLQSSFQYMDADNQMQTIHHAGPLGEVRRDDLAYYATHPYYREQHAVAMPFIDDTQTLCLYLAPSDGPLGKEIYIAVGSDRSTVGAFFHLLGFHQSAS